MVNDKLQAQAKILHVADDKIGHRLNPNSTVKVVRTYFGEIIYTNDYGWRVASNRERKIKNQNIHFLAVHFVWELENDYEDSIVGHIEKKMNVKINI